MSSCEKADQWQLAVLLFEMMPLKRLQPDSISFSAVFFHFFFYWALGAETFFLSLVLPFPFTIFRDFFGGHIATCEHLTKLKE